MSRTKYDRMRSRIGQIHCCAICYEDGNNSKQLTWMLEIPPESDTYAKLLRQRTWFCRACLTTIYATDPIFTERNQHLTLKEPVWWTQPASAAQRNFLDVLLAERAVEPELREEIDLGLHCTTKGQMYEWLELLKLSKHARRPPTPPAAQPTTTADPWEKAFPISKTVH